VVAVNELPVRPEYYPLLMLSSGLKREEFPEAILRQGETYYLDYALLTTPEEVHATAEKMGVLPMRTLEENVQILIAHGDLDADVLTRQLIRERGVEGLAGSLDALEKEALTRQLLVDLGVDEETIRRLLDERPRSQEKRSG